MYELYPSLKGTSSKKSKKMEAFRFGFDFPIQKKAAASVFRSSIPKKPVRPRPIRRYRYRVPRTVIVTPVKKFVMKTFTPKTFSLELDNMFEILDV